MNLVDERSEVSRWQALLAEPRIQRLLLVVMGLALGLLLIGLSYPLLRYWLQRGRANASFNTVSEFQRTMLERGDEDIKPDRSVSFRSIVAPHPSLRLMYDLLPNLDVKFQGVPLRTNSCGMRSPEVSVARAPNTYRLALLGDSFAFGWGVEQHESFAQVIEDQLNKAFGGNPRVEVLNFGVPGYSTFQEVALFEERALEFDPDAVLVYFVENDFGLPFFVSDAHQAGSVVDATTFARSSWRRDDPVVNEKSKDVVKLLDPNNALRRLISLTRDRGMKLFFTMNPKGEWKQDYRRVWILRRARQAVRFIPLPDLFRAYIEKHNISSASLKLPTDPHPNAAKHRILGELLAQELARQIPE